MKFSIEAPENEVALPGEIHLHLRFRPASVPGILFVILIHALLLYFLLNMHPVKPKKQGDDAEMPISLILNQPNKVTASKDVSTPKKTSPQQAAPPQKPRKPSPVPRQEPAPVAQTEPPVKAPPVAEPPPQTDMMAMVNAARERRRAAEDSAAQENQAAANGSHGMSPQEVIAANVRHSMQTAAGRDGTNGVFQILSKSTRVGSFSFRGWRPNSNSSWKQVIEVDAGLGGNIELAMVRRMIELIRTHYQGDFNWESHRLGRVVVLSARPQDSAELEAFLMREFFG